MIFSEWKPVWRIAMAKKITKCFSAAFHVTKVYFMISRF